MFSFTCWEMFLKVQQKGGTHVSISPIFLLTIAHIIRSVSMCGLYVFVLLSYFINTYQVSLVSAGPHPAAGWAEPFRPSRCLQGALLRFDLSSARFQCALKQSFLCKLKQRSCVHAGLMRLFNGCGDTGFTGICFGAGGAE